MSEATIRTELDNLRYVPGETLRGGVSWRAESVVGSAELRLFYYTEGRGTRDVVVADTVVWPSPPQIGEEAFSFVLPSGPYTFSGRLVSLIWALELVIGPDLATGRLEIVVSPTAEAIDLGRYPVPPGLDNENAAKRWLREKMESRGGR